MAFKVLKVMGDRLRTSSLISLSSRIFLVYFLLNIALRDEVIRVVAFLPNQRVHLDVDSASHRDAYYTRPSGQKLQFDREHSATTLWTPKDNRTLRLSSIARSMELWLDAREGIEGWQKFQGSADRVLFDHDRERSRESCSSTVKQLLVKGDGKLLDQSEQVVGLSMIVGSPRDQSRALALIGSVEWIQVTCSDWTMIPAENLVSVAGSTPTKIAVELSEPSQVQGAAFALQLGVDALLLRPDSDLWASGVAAREQRNAAARLTESSPQLSSDLSQGSSNSAEQGGGHASLPEGGKEVVLLSSALVTGTKEAGVGDRVCVDLIQNLGEGEGMLVGSSAKTLVLVHAETFETGFVPSRPFRVNAGPVHSYALMADGSTKYHSELKAGDQVLVVDHSGASRAVTIGRLKVEARPMMMIQFECDSTTKGQIFLQQAETVRLIQPSRGDDDSEGRRRPWEPLPVTDVIGGEQILVREVRRGTHIGKPIEAVVVES